MIYVAHHHYYLFNSLIIVYHINNYVFLRCVETNFAFKFVALYLLRYFNGTVISNIKQ